VFSAFGIKTKLNVVRWTVTMSHRTNKLGGLNEDNLYEII